MLLPQKKKGVRTAPAPEGEAALRKEESLSRPDPLTDFSKLSASPAFPRKIDDFFRSFVLYMKHEKGLDFSGLADLYVEKPSEVGIPISIFSTELSPAESLCKYLHENHHLSFREIGRLLHRDERGIWTNVHRAAKKSAEPFTVIGEDLHIPLSVLAERDRSVLENVVLYLTREKGMRIADIARTIRRPASALHTVLHRAQDKQERKSAELPPPSEPAQDAEVPR